MTTKKHYMVLDTETVADARIPFDIAYTIIDRKGNVVKQANYLTAEIFNTVVGRHLIANDSFSKNKAEKYLTIDAPITSFAVIRDNVRKDIEDYNCVVTAYNAKFDYSCLTNFAKAYGFDNFFSDNTVIWDMWNIALTILANSKNYIKFCKDNNFVSDKGNIKTSAEIMYRYLSQDINFVESHTALDDTEIEAEILKACFKRKQKLETDYVVIFRHPVWQARCKA